MKKLNKIKGKGRNSFAFFGIIFKSKAYTLYRRNVYEHIKKNHEL